MWVGMYIDRQVGRWVGRCLGLYIRYPQSHWLITVVQMKIANFIHKKNRGTTSQVSDQPISSC